MIIILNAELFQFMAYHSEQLALNGANVDDNICSLIGNNLNTRGDEGHRVLSRIQLELAENHLTAVMHIRLKGAGHEIPVAVPCSGLLRILVGRITGVKEVDDVMDTAKLLEVGAGGNRDGVRLSGHAVFSNNGDVTAVDAAIGGILHVSVTGI